MAKNALDVIYIVTYVYNIFIDFFSSHTTHTQQDGTTKATSPTLNKGQDEESMGKRSSLLRCRPSKTVSQQAPQSHTSHKKKKKKNNNSIKATSVKVSGCFVVSSAYSSHLTASLT